MSPAALAFWNRATSRMATLRPGMAQALLKALSNIAANMSEPEMARLIQSGALDQLLAAVTSDALLDRALLPVRQRIRSTVDRSFQYAVRDLPAAGTVDGTLAVAFDHLNPRVIDAIRSLETPVLQSIKEDARDMVRASVENGLRDGTPPSTIARSIRGAVGIGPSQVQEVENFRDAILGRNGRSITDYTLRNTRIDGVLAKGAASDDQVERYVTMYRKARIAQNANVVAKQATRDSYRVGQRLAWQDAQDSGVIPDGFVAEKTWVHFDPQPDPRPEHQALNGETVPADQSYSTGQMSAGEGDYGCHCIDRFSLGKAA